MQERWQDLGYEGPGGREKFQRVHGLDPTGPDTEWTLRWLESGDAWRAPDEPLPISEHEVEAFLPVLEALLVNGAEPSGQMAAGLRLLGPRLFLVLEHLRTRTGLEDKGREWISAAASELGAWLQGAGLSDAPQDVELRAAAAQDIILMRAELWSIFPACADAIMAEPSEHPFLHAELPRRAVRFAILRAEQARDATAYIRAVRRALTHDFASSKDEARAWIEAASAMADQGTADAEELPHLWGAAFDHTGESKYRDRMVRAAGADPHARASAWLRSVMIHVRAEQWQEAADCLEQALGEKGLNREATISASVKAARLRLSGGQPARVEALLNPEVLDGIELWYLEAVGAEEIRERGEHFKEACDLLAMAAVQEGRWARAVKALDRPQGRRFRWEMACRKSPEVREAERRLKAVERGVDYRAAGGRIPLKGTLAETLPELTLVRQDYWEARRRAVDINALSPGTWPDNRRRESGEAVVVMGLHWSGTVAAVFLPGDAAEPSGRFQWPGCTQEWAAALLRGPEARFLLEIEQGGDQARLSIELRKLLAALEQGFGLELGTWLTENGVAKLAIVPHGFYRIMPLWAMPALASLEVRMLSSLQEWELSRDPAGLIPRALVVTNPTGDLPLAELQGQIVSEAANWVAAKELSAERAGKEEILDSMDGCGIFHFSGHGLPGLAEDFRAALVVAPRWERAGLNGPLDLAALGGNQPWIEEGEERRLVIEGRGQLQEERDSETGRVQRWFHYSDTGSLWATIDAEQGAPSQTGELLNAADLALDPRFATCRLAVLSACSSGVESIPSTEEPAGLPGALKAAGVRSLVSAFWPVTQELACLFVQEFYRLPEGGVWDLRRAVHAAREAIRGMSREEAARRVRSMAAGKDAWESFQVDVAVRRIETGAEQPFADPVHWGAFFLQGDAALRIEEPR